MKTRVLHFGAAASLAFALAIGLFSTGARAEVDAYSLSVTVSASGRVGNPFLGQTYTGTFLVDTTTGDVTDFSADLLDSSPPFTAADLGDVAQFDGSGHVDALVFQSAATAADGSHNFGFNTGFNCSGQIQGILGLSCSNYFAYLDTSGFVQGGGTPVFSTVPEPATLSLFGIGVAGLAVLRRRRQR
jgi:hypothetical protein